ncbi:hypothetical protein EVAR_33439_1 [Eumeta japonica]|uniref:Uncharacterized protein n=1 Tax=Eumeta variegata TaxID=151549 RepID=A0A4C1W2C6_EUMVA|nr:hypothetical protein EVAR_33439_1 [Eumeta japonica]
MASSSERARCGIAARFTLSGIYLYFRKSIALELTSGDECICMARCFRGRRRAAVRGRWHQKRITMRTSFDRVRRRLQRRAVAAPHKRAFARSVPNFLSHHFKLVMFLFVCSRLIRSSKCEEELTPTPKVIFKNLL